MKVVCLWSGGKDSCFASYRAVQQGYDIVSLLNFLDIKGKKSLSHGLAAWIIQEQLASTGLSYFQKAMSKETYRKEFIKLINEWKIKGSVEGIVFGDIYLQEHKDWIDKVCEELEVEEIMPLWEADTGVLIEEFVRAGFRAIVVAANAQLLGKEWLGRQIDREFIKDLKALGSIDLCGEKGEFHTFVYDGPLFKKSLEITKGRKILRDKNWFLELK